MYYVSLINKNIIELIKSFQKNSMKSYKTFIIIYKMHQRFKNERGKIRIKKSKIIYNKLPNEIFNKRNSETLQIQTRPKTINKRKIHIRHSVQRPNTHHPLKTWNISITNAAEKRWKKNKDSKRDTAKSETTTTRTDAPSRARGLQSAKKIRGGAEKNRCRRRQTYAYVAAVDTTPLKRWTRCVDVYARCIRRVCRGWGCLRRRRVIRIGGPFECGLLFDRNAFGFLWGLVLYFLIESVGGFMLVWGV